MPTIKLNIFARVVSLLLCCYPLHWSCAQDTNSPFGAKPNPFGTKPDPFASRVDPFNKPTEQLGQPEETAPEKSLLSRTGRSTKTLIKHCIRDGKSQAFCECQAQETVKLQRHSSSNFSDATSSKPDAAEVNQLLQDMQHKANAINSKCGHL